jgi:hypothetical protein
VKRRPKASSVVPESDAQSVGSLLKQFEGPPSPVEESWPTDPICFTCDEVGHVAKNCGVLDVIEEAPIQYLGGKGTNCENCGVFGHDQAHCNPLFLQEEKPDVCDYCKKGSHEEDRCWKLHPGLKIKFLKEQERQKCHECGATGRVRRWCHLLQERK